MFSPVYVSVCLFKERIGGDDGQSLLLKTMLIRPGNIPVRKFPAEAGNFLGDIPFLSPPNLSWKDFF
ncbi:MAG: hypothetical protein COT24_00310 [Candidatus Kerfeldbacteria bacterium CG08_land_8_20_14_0_20_40_16]|uniref:Uncharacterized protein n=1 Tax=Candidatus Kerfeldbacteria bacterium CG08_land_8_20_14_0_20_40_16 TaxID=2014244 RepID=A0A2H0YZ76_9BACT|nr:MAG: hypothetical protein COT24_00310 [Candidatus Kerfeldbacteria bacterium CG08_land_8_20_14_0_20_40_16]